MIKLLIDIIKEHMAYRKQIVKLAKADLIRTYRGAALRLGLGNNKTCSNNICILVCFFSRA